MQEEQKTMEVRQTPIKINSLSFQINVIYKDIEKNIQRIDISLKQYSKSNNLDIVLFPEMALMGYHFESEEDVKPFAEQQQKGKTFEFGARVAKDLNSYVVIGYPEQYINEQNEEEYYNAAYVIDRDGKLLQNIRKKHLFITDKTWAHEGQQFNCVELINREGVHFKCGVGICMDINPYEFLDNSAFEWAEYLKEQKIDVVIFIQNWVDNEPNRLDGASIQAIIDYFMWRLRPLINTKKELRYNKEWLFLSCNRVGKEYNVLYEKGSQDYEKQQEYTYFIGSSAAIKLNPHELIYNLDKTEGILLSEAKLQ